MVASKSIMKSVVPTILTADSDVYAKRLALSEKMSDWVSVDFMGGTFTKETSVGLEVVMANKTKLMRELDVMVNTPERYVNAAAKAGVNRFVFHAEAVEQPERMLSMLADHGLEAGVSLNPETGVEALAPYVGKVQYVLLLAVHPGRGGQKTADNTITKARQIIEQFPFITLAVDGGVKDHNIVTLAHAGIDILEVGSGIFAQPDSVVAYKKLHDLVAQAS